MFPGKLHS